MTDDLAAWLQQQLDEDERQARDWPDDMDARWYNVPAYTPARVLVEVAAKRRILAEHEAEPWVRDLSNCRCCSDKRGDAMEDWPCATVRLLALPYADREGFREEWRP